MNDVRGLAKEKRQQTAKGPRVADETQTSAERRDLVDRHAVLNGQVLERPLPFPDRAANQARAMPALPQRMIQQHHVARRAAKIETGDNSYDLGRGVRRR